SRFRIALPQQAARALLHHDYRNDSTASRMRSLYALHLSLSVAIPAIQPRLRLSGTNRLRSAFHGGQRQRMLEIYALRWGIEIYFKEAKQHLGFLQEQTTTFASHTASVHLCAIRYLMLVHNKLEDPDFRVGDIRSQIQEQLDSLGFAGKLWQIFRVIISGTLSELQATLGYSMDTVMLAIDKRVSEFFISSLQLDAFTMQLEYE
ncbi:MAG: transposase, partial [Candidatus Thiodiazotropha sp. (ex Lucinoma aequizonata)]|nr:transposase [Candidatus Thiodiazotropha sp. (ex Lucinoma aequizonata)]MCU7899982.1 transposase [Candidatus Thiodiazotropha sp. (ex Lucinoma aequizonata)]